MFSKLFLKVLLVGLFSPAIGILGNNIGSIDNAPEGQEQKEHRESVLMLSELC